MGIRNILRMLNNLYIIFHKNVISVGDKVIDISKLNITYCLHFVIEDKYQLNIIVVIICLGLQRWFSS